MTLTFEEAVELQHTYTPTDKDMLHELGSISLAPIVGPTAVGKNRLMAILADRRGYHQAGNVVSRDLRDNDPPNIQHRELSALLEDIENGRVIQFAALLGNHAIYATVLENYQQHQINTKDIYAHSIDGFMNYGFGRVRPVGIVVPPAIWEPRLDKRFGQMPQEERAIRLDEAAQSIHWILEGSPTIPRVITIGEESYIDEATERINAFLEMRQDVPAEQIHYDTAEQMLNALPDLREKYLTKD